MNWTAWNKKLYNKKQKQIQSLLNESGKNLADKLILLYEQQRSSGFVQDDLSEVKRCWVVNPQDHEKCFLIQYNPRRSERKKGSGVICPPGIKPINNGCFLCAENIFWQQRGLELGYKIEVNEKNSYWCWCNPYPLMPVHMTIASSSHETQKWIDNNIEQGDQSRVRRIINDLLKIVSQTPGFIAFYNGLGAGATIPTHLHFQFFKRPTGQVIYPLEKTVKQQVMHGHKVPFRVEDYPITCIYFRGSCDKICDDVVKCISAWTKACNYSDNLSANIIATLDHLAIDNNDKNLYSVYIIPRNTLFSVSPGRKGVVGGLEVLGEIVFTDPKEFERLEAGLINYDYVCHILRSVEAQTVHEFLEQTRNTLRI